MKGKSYGIFLCLWEALQDQQLGLTQAPIKLLLPPGRVLMLIG